jgi:hypothetical protein
MRWAAATYQRHRSGKARQGHEYQNPQRMNTIPEKGKAYVITLHDHSLFIGTCKFSAYEAVIIDSNFTFGRPGSFCVRAIASCHEIPVPLIDESQWQWMQRTQLSL